MKQSQHGISDLDPKKKKIPDNARTPMEFNDMCDNVIDIILCNLKLEDLANVSDTNQRLRNIAGSIFVRKYGNHLMSIDTFHYSNEINEGFKYSQSVVRIESKPRPIVRISDAKIWFKLLRNFGQFTKYIAIQCDYTTKHTTNIPDALKNLNNYIHEYCTESLEILELRKFLFFALNKPLTKLHTFIAFGHRDDPENIEAWNSKTLHFMPNLRSLNILDVPIALENHLPQLERFTMNLKSEEHVRSFISFLHLNRQITYLKLIIDVDNCDDLIFSAIEKFLTQLEILKVVYWGNKRNDPIQPIPIYRFKTVKSFSSAGTTAPDLVLKSFKFDNLEKFKLSRKLNSKWMDFIFSNKQLKIFKMGYWDMKWLERKGHRRIIQLTNLPELEQIIVLCLTKSHVICKEILGSEWQQNLFHFTFKGKISKGKYQRIVQKS